MHIMTSHHGRDVLDERDANVACLACKKQLMHFGLENVYNVDQHVHGKDHKRESLKHSLVKRPISGPLPSLQLGRCAPLAFGFACCSRNRNLRSVWRRVHHRRVHAACPRYGGTWPCEQHVQLLQVPQPPVPCRLTMQHEARWRQHARCLTCGTRRTQLAKSQLRHSLLEHPLLLGKSAARFSSADLSRSVNPY